MKKFFLVGAAVAAVLVISGCMSTHTNDGTATVPVRIQENVFKADVVAGKEKVSGEATVKCVLGIFTWGANKFADEAFASRFQILPSVIDRAKQGAAYNACAAAKADTILAAKYVLDIKDFVVYKEVKCKVTGFPGTIKSVK